MTIESWSVAEVSEFLVANDCDEKVVELFCCNKIRGKVLKLLTEKAGLAGNGFNHHRRQVAVKPPITTGI